MMSGYIGDFKAVRTLEGFRNILAHDPNAVVRVKCVAPIERSRGKWTLEISLPEDEVDAKNEWAALCNRATMAPRMLTSTTGLVGTAVSLGFHAPVLPLKKGMVVEWRRSDASRYDIS